MARPRVTIVQPYVPGYRVSFFEGLIAFLDERGVDCVVVAEEASGEQALRGDAVERDWIQTVKSRSLKLGNRSVNLGGNRSVWSNSDIVIIGLTGSSLDSHRAVIDDIRGRIKVGLWGHVKSYVSDGSRIDYALERWQMRNATRVFAYTPTGADFAAAAGVERRNITTVMNAIDTDSLVTAKNQLDQSAVDEFVRTNGLIVSKTVGYIGGLDGPKRIDFIADVLDELWRVDREVKLLVGGKGGQANLLMPAVTRGQAIHLGYAGDAEKALIGRTSTLLLSPGRIGLLSVDALVLGVPLVTTPWPYHAPEAEYLVAGESRIDAPDDAIRFARRVLDELEARATSAQVPGIWWYPTLPQMIENFGNGIMSMIVPPKARS